MTVSHFASQIFSLLRELHLLACFVIPHALKIHLFTRGLHCLTLLAGRWFTLVVANHETDYIEYYFGIPQEAHTRLRSNYAYFSLRLSLFRLMYFIIITFKYVWLALIACYSRHYKNALAPRRWIYKNGLNIYILYWDVYSLRKRLSRRHYIYSMCQYITLQEHLLSNGFVVKSIVLIMHGQALPCRALLRSCQCIWIYTISCHYLLHTRRESAELAVQPPSEIPP